MKLAILTEVLRKLRAVVPALIVGVSACGAHQALEYPTDGIVPAYPRYDSHRLRQVQIALRKWGYYTGAVDGFMGYRTDLAISRFQLDHCHPVRPVVDQWLLANLGIIRPVVD